MRYTKWSEVRKLAEVLICGFGVVGQRAAFFLERNNLTYIAIDEKKIEHPASPYVGNVASEEMLKRAGIEDTSTLLAVTDDDKTNAFVTLLAKKLNKDVTILARVEKTENIDKLDKAGADYILPMTRAGRFLAKSAIEPFVVDFLDMVSLTEDIEITQVTVNEKSKLANTSIKKAKIWKKTGGVQIIAIRRETLSIVSPTQDEQLQPNDKMIVIGNAKQIKALHNLADPEKIIESLEE